MILKDDELMIEVHPERGTIRSLIMEKDPLHTECVGNPDLVSYQSIQEMNQWIGDWRIRVWDETAGSWTDERTADSIDIRRVVQNGNTVTVSYEGCSHKNKGLSNVNLTQTYTLKEGILYWDVTLKNNRNRPTEVGELSMVFITNTDFSGVFEKPLYWEEERWRGWKQRIWHEERMQRHLSINGCSSYAFLQRPKGDQPSLLFQTAAGTGLEAAYQMDPHIGWQWMCTFEGPYYLSVYSKAARKCEGWKQYTEAQRYWLNGNTSAVLGAGEEKKYHFILRPVYKDEDRNTFLYDAGQVAVDVQPGMAAPAGEKIRLRLHCRDDIRLERMSNNIEISDIRTENGYFYCTVRSSEPGQKKIKIHHGTGYTNLFFYILEDPWQLIKRHASFAAHNQFYENPDDPYHRNHSFLPYDDSVQAIYTESEESWQVGASDEYALPVAMFLAEKNVWDPDDYEISVLEAFVNDFLYGVLQQKDTYYARRGMYYEDRTPSDEYYGIKWDKATAEDILRSFNYPLIIDIYFALYQVGRKHHKLKTRSADEYLEMAWRTAMVGYGTGQNKYNGAPAGATLTEFLRTLKTEQPDWYDQLNPHIALIAAENAKSEYPYGSELYVDQTAHNQLEAMMNYYGYADKLKEVYQVTYALRNGWQPAWFLYGNEKRGNVCCWYGTPLNSRVLFNGFDFTGNIDYLRMAYSGLFSFLTCLKGSGAAHGWFLWWPDRTGFDSRSLDTDMGMYGFIKSVRSYMVSDPVFGISGYGCDVECTDDKYRIRIYDGMGIKFSAPSLALNLETGTGQMRELLVDAGTKTCTIYTQSPEFSLVNTEDTEWKFNIIRK